MKLSDRGPQPGQLPIVSQVSQIRILKCKRQPI